jgi:hypothetical protein
MPYIYAIAVEIYDEGTPPRGGVWELHPVSEETAETHKDGRWMLVSHTGQTVTEWNSFFHEYRTSDTTKVGHGKPLRDAVGTELAVGDFVMTTKGNHPTLHLMEVISFTPKKIRIRDIRSFGKGNVKNPEDIIKVDKSIFF